GHADRRKVELNLKLRQYGQIYLRARLARLDRHRAVTNVLPPEAHHVAAAQAGTDQKGERQPGLRTGRMPCLEGGNVFLSPGVESARVLSARGFVAGCRVGIDYAPRDSKGHQATQRLEHISLRVRLEAVEQFSHVPRLHHGKALIAVLGTEPLQQRAAHLLRGCRKLGEGLGVEVGSDNCVYDSRVVAVGTN